MKKAYYVLTFVAIFAASLLLVERANAATRVWTGTASTSWNTGGAGGNWNGAAVPGSADLVQFNNLSANNLATNDDVPGGASILGISNIAVSGVGPASDVSISGNPLTIGSSGIVFGTGSSGALRSLAVNTDITVGASQIWSLGGTPATNKLTIGTSSANTVNLGSNTLTLKWNTVGGQTMDIKSTISGTGAVNLLRIGASKSQIRFESSNTYSGGTSIDQGGEVVQFGKDALLVFGSIPMGPLGTGSTVSGVPNAIAMTNLTTGGSAASLEAYGGDRTIEYNWVFSNNLPTAGGTTGNAFNVITSPGETNHKLTLNGTLTMPLGNRTITTDATTASGSGDLVMNGKIFVGQSGQPGSQLLFGTSGGTPSGQSGKIWVNNDIVQAAGVTSGVQVNVINGSSAFPTRVQFGGQNNYSGGTIIGAGAGLVSLASSTTMSGPTIVSGPLGTGTVAINNGGNAPRMEAVGNQTLANDINFNTTSSLIIQGSDNLTLTGLISPGPLNTGGANIIKNGTGTLTLTNANTYIGTTTVSSGSLLASNTSGSATGTGAGANVSVNGAGSFSGVTGTGGTLGGNGSVAGNVTINGNSAAGPGGVLSPGESVGSLGIGGNLQFNAPAPGPGANGSVLKFEIGPKVGLEYTADLVNAVSGSLTLPTTPLTVGATLSLVDAGAPAFIPAGTKYTVIAYNGTWNDKPFVNAPLLITMGSTTFRIRYKDMNPGGNFLSETNNNIANGSLGAGVTAGTRYVTLTAVPELGSFITMGLVGCFAVAAVRFGKRHGFKAFGF